MTVVAFASAKGSPGATTAALLLAASWPAPRRAMLVEADPAGGDVAAWFDLGTDPGLVSLVAAGRHSLDPGIVAEHVQQIPGARPIDALLAPASVEQATAALSAARGRLSSALAEQEVDVLVDCGRLDASSPAADLALSADLLVWVVRPTLGDVHHLSSRVHTLRRTGPTAVLAIGSTLYSAEDVGEAVGLPTVGLLPRDDRAASALRGEASATKLDRMPLLRAARSIAESFGTLLSTGVTS